MIEQGLGGYYTITIIRNPQNSIGNYLGSYSNTCTQLEPCDTSQMRHQQVHLITSEITEVVPAIAT